MQSAAPPDPGSKYIVSLLMILYRPIEAASITNSLTLIYSGTPSITTREKKERKKKKLHLSSACS